MTEAFRGMTDAAFERTADYRERRGIEGEVCRNASGNGDYDAAEHAARRERIFHENLKGALAILAVMLDAAGYDMTPTYPDSSPAPCPIRAEAELDKWLDRRRASRRTT